MLRELLDSKKCFKLVCGAGNEDAVEVEKLVKLYSTAGCKFFDLSAKPEIVDAAKQGLEDREGYLCVSVGIQGDPHIRKAEIDFEKCSECRKCEEICPQKTIRNSKVNIIRCIGCGKCYSVCKHNAISFTSETKNLNEVLPPLIEKGIDCIELHAMNEDDNEAFAKWACINNHFEGILSICTARGKLSEEKMLNRIKKMIENREEFTTIVQADGYPMSGGADDYKLPFKQLQQQKLYKMLSYLSIQCFQAVQIPKLPNLQKCVQ